MHFEQLTYPQTTIITLQEAKDHLRVDGTDEDSVIKDCIKSATDFVQRYVNQVFLSGSCVVYYDSSEVETYKALDIWTYPVQSVTAVKYLNTSGIETTLSTSDYTVDSVSYPTRIMVTSMPTMQTDVFNQFRVYMTVGYIDRDKIAPELIGWVKILTGFFYETRQTEFTGVGTSEIQMRFERALDKHRKDPIV